MKIGKKMILFLVTMIAIILSWSRYSIVKNNFFHALENGFAQNRNQHILEKYMLENEIIQNIQAGEEVTPEKMVEALKALSSYQAENASALVALYTETNEKIYSNIPETDDFEKIFQFSQETENYALRTIDGKHYMLFSSPWQISHQTIFVVNAYQVDNLYQEKDRQMAEIGFTNGVILVVSTVIIAIFSVFLTKPLERLNKTSKKIASGQFQERVNLKSHDEIGELADSFNKMAEQIEQKVNQLHLQIEQKNDFIQGFSHELKTPMTAMVGYADLLRFKQCDPALAKKALNYIYFETKRLEKLSFQLMKLMRLRDEKVELEAVSMVQLAQKMPSMLVTENQLVLDVEPAVVKANKELLQVVIRNLVENADKAQPKDQKILLTGRKIEGHKYQISVIDQGIGIPQEHIWRVTEDFYQVDPSRSGEKSGNGIGLSLVKKILELHQTQLKIESQENVGTTVFFELEEGEIPCEN